MLARIFLTVCNMTLTGSCVILILLLARAAMSRLPRVYSFALWGVAALRLLCPFSFKSVRALIPVKAEPFSPSLLIDAEPQIDSGITILDQAVNPVLRVPTGAETGENGLQAVFGILALIWLVGCIGLILANVWAVLRLRHCLRSAEPLCADCMLSDAVSGPFVLGTIRPRIYLPASLPASARPLILLHERAHIRRRDHLTKLLGFVVVAVHWFNPLVWLAFHFFERDMEMSCDEAVMRDLAEDRRAEYSRLLLNLATDRRFAAPQLAFGESDTGARIKHILRYRKPAVWAGAAALVIVLILGIALLFSRAESEKDVDAADAAETTAETTAAETTAESTAEPAPTYTLHQLTFPAYEQREGLHESWYIDPFTMTIPLPTGWTVVEASAEEKQTAFGTPLYFYDGETQVGSVAFRTATWVESGKGNPMMYFQGYVLGSIVNWGIDLQMAYDHGDSGVATSKLAVNQMDGVAAAASSIKYYPAILAYLRDGDKILQVAMSFSEGAFDDAALAEIASHITLKKQ